MRVGAWLLSCLLCAAWTSGAQEQTEATGPARPAVPAAPQPAPKEEAPTASKGAEQTQGAAAEEGERRGLLPEYFKLSGVYRHRYYRDLFEDERRENPDEWRNDLRLNAEFIPQKDVRLILSGDGRLDIARSERDGFGLEEDRLRLWEAYVKATLGPADLRVGRQVIRWGKSDEINPIDNFTPEDLSELINFDRADRKLPSWMFLGDFQVATDFTYEASWQPFFEPNKFAPGDSDWYFPVLRDFKALGFGLEKDPPPKTLQNQVAANRMLYHGPVFDMGLSYAWHFNQNPALEIKPPRVLPGPPLVFILPQLDLEHRRQHTFGLDFETTCKGIGFRGEGALTLGDRISTSDPADSDKVVDRNSVNFVTGLDYTFKNDLYLNIQYSGKFVFDYTAGMAGRQYEQSVIWSFSRPFLREKFKLSLNGRYYFNPVGHYLKPKAEYRVNDHLRISVFLELFGGEQSSILGSFRHNDQAGVEFKVVF